MNRKKLTELNLYAGIDTLQFTSEAESLAENINDLSFVSENVYKNTKNNTYNYKVNPDKANGEIEIYNGVDYYKMRNYMLDELKLTSPIISRIDYRFDSLDDNYNELLKLNKLLILLIVKQYSVNNRYFSADLLTQDLLTVRAQNDRIEVENYNKSLQEPDGIVCNRLELRSLRLNDGSDEENKEYTEFLKWCNRLDKAVTAENFQALIDELNDFLYVHHCKESTKKGFTLNKFLYKYQNCIFTSEQMKSFYARLGYADPQGQARLYKHRNEIEYFSLKDLLLYVDIIKTAGQQFFST